MVLDSRRQLKTAQINNQLKTLKIISPKVFLQLPQQNYFRVLWHISYRNAILSFQRKTKHPHDSFEIRKSARQSKEVSMLLVTLQRFNF